MTPKIIFAAVLLLDFSAGSLAFQIPLNGLRLQTPLRSSLDNQDLSYLWYYQPSGVLGHDHDYKVSLKRTSAASTTQLKPHNTRMVPPALVAVAVFGTPLPALASAGPIPSAALAWLHFVGIMGVAGGLVTERFLIKENMSEKEEMLINNADGIYGLSAFSLLISGYFRATGFAKGWDFYKNEPIFWLKMSAVAVLGGLSFFPAIIFFRRDQARQKGESFAPLSAPIVDRITTIINAELLALVTIPFFASLMARGVLYVDDFPWAIGVVLYAVSLGGAGFKYGTEAFEIMEAENALVPLKSEDLKAD